MYEKEEIVDKVRLTPTQQYEYSTRYWLEVYLKFCMTLAEDIGWDKVNEMLQRSSLGGWPMATDALSRLDVGERDARAWAVTEASVGVNAWPGYVEGFLDFSPEFTSNKGTGVCVVLEVARKLGIQDKIDLFPWCATAADAYLRKINPKLKFVQWMAMCRGDEYDMGAAVLTEGEVTGSKHAYERAWPFQGKK
jgi:hypothetical protein